MTFDSALFWSGIAGAMGVFCVDWGVINIPDRAVLLQDGWSWLSGHAEPMELAVYCMVPYALYYLYVLCCTQFIYDKTLESGGHMPKNLKNRYTHSGRVPGPFPNGWFVVGLSAELERGDVRQVSILGKEFALFRGQNDGMAHVVDAFCPHLGANLAIDGKVEKDCITCPFHGWSFEGDSGKCVNIAYSKKIPSAAKVGSRPVLERNGSIYMWHHCDGEAPSWEVPEYESIATRAVRCDGFSRHEISAHIQEVPENGADVAHLNYLHTSPVVHFLGYFGITHLWSATWAPMSGKNSHVAQIELTQCLQFLGKWQVPGTALDVSIKQYGPGVVILQFNSKIGKFYIVQSVTPLEPMRQQIIHAVYSPWFIPRMVGKGLLWSVVDQVERDIPIWNNKTYRPSPLLANGDGRIGQFRRWFSQFYTEEVKAAARQTTSILDW